VLEAPDCEVDFGGFRRHAQFHGALQSLRPPMNGPTADTP
jgi:hypothetical protein